MAIILFLAVIHACGAVKVLRTEAYIDTSIKAADIDVTEVKQFTFRLQKCYEVAVTLKTSNGNFRLELLDGILKICEPSCSDRFQISDCTEPVVLGVSWEDKLFNIAVGCQSTDVISSNTALVSPPVDAEIVSYLTTNKVKWEFGEDICQPPTTEAAATTTVTTTSAIATELATFPATTAIDPETSSSASTSNTTVKGSPVTALPGSKGSGNTVGLPMLSTIGMILVANHIF